MARSVNAYATYATGFKSVGLNLNGVPTDASNQPVLVGRDGEAGGHPQLRSRTEDGAVPRRHRERHASYDTEIKNFQAQVTNGSVGVIRGYLANAEKVRVRGAEFDGSARVGCAFLDLRGRGLHRRQVRHVPGRAAAARRHRRAAVRGHLRIPAARHLEVGALARRRVRPGPRRSSAGREPSSAPSTRSYRSSFSSSATYSKYLVVDGYALLNARVGFRAADGWTLSLWSRNLLNKDYFELLTAAPGNTGLFVGQPGDRRTIGVTLRVALKARK